MIDVKDDTNVVYLRGELDENMEFSHEILEKSFLMQK